MSVSSAVVEVTKRSGKSVVDTTGTITLGPGIMGRIHNNVSESTRRSGA